MALACSAPSDNRTRWTIQLLADQLVFLQVVDGVSDKILRRTVKKRAEALAAPAVVHADSLRRHWRPLGAVWRVCGACSESSAPGNGGETLQSQP